MIDAGLAQYYYDSLSEFERARLKAQYLKQMAASGHIRRAYDSVGWQHPRVQKDFWVYVVCQVPPHFSTLVR